MRNKKGFILFMLVLIPVLAILAGKTKPVEISMTEHAIFSCIDSIESHLLNPDSAYFDNRLSYAYPTHVKNVWVAQVTVKAKNGFNADVYASYLCTVKKYDNDWRVLSLKRIPR